MSESVTSVKQENEAGSGATALVDQSGRPLGTRALQTRQRILDATVAELATKSMRDLRVIDIARRVGSSPATFYQYFKDIEDVVLHLSEQASARTPRVVEMIHGDWTGPAGFERAKLFVNRAMDHWDEYGSILRVRNNAADEGDERFRDVRIRAIMPMIGAFAEEIAASQVRARESGPIEEVADAVRPEGSIDPRAGAMAIFAFVDRMAMFHKTVEELGTSREELVETAATLMQFLLTSRK